MVQNKISYSKALVSKGKRQMHTPVPWHQLFCQVQDARSSGDLWKQPCIGCFMPMPMGCEARHM